jgi:hypothetical protein
VACNILLVAGLFADKEDIGLLRSFAEDELGCVLVEVAARAGFRLTFERIEVGGVGAFKREGRTEFRCDVHDGDPLAFHLQPIALRIGPVCSEQRAASGI